MIILYEVFYRLKEILLVMVEILGDWEIVVMCEFIKKYEEFIRGMIFEVIEWVNED